MIMATSGAPIFDKEYILYDNTAQNPNKPRRWIFRGRCGINRDRMHIKHIEKGKITQQRHESVVEAREFWLELLKHGWVEQK